MLKVKFHRAKISLPALCVTCGARYIKEAIEAALWKDNQRIGSICQECIRMCSEGLSQVLKRQSQSLRERASVLEELSHQPIECPPWEEYLQALEKEKPKESEEARPQMIMSRVIMIGEDIIPKDELEGLKPDHVRIFLTEPDPAKWPTEILHLRKYIEQEIE